MNQQGLSDGTIQQNQFLFLVTTKQSVQSLEFRNEYRALLNELQSGWQTYIGVRFQETANEQTQEIVVQPHQIDGLSFSMTIVYLIKLLKLTQKQSQNIVIMGASAKSTTFYFFHSVIAEERIFTQTNYYEELTNFYPNITFTFYFVGPELSSQRNNKVHKINDRIQGHFFRGQTSEFLLDIGMSQDKIYEKLSLDSSIFLGYNPGFGSGYELLLNSWCTDLVQLLNLQYTIIFTQANDYSDLRGESKVFQVIFENKVNYILQPQENPFRAVTHYHEEGKKETSWSCSSTHFYGLQGWKNDNDKLTVKQIRDNIKSEKGKKLLQELMLYSNAGSQQ